MSASCVSRLMFLILLFTACAIAADKASPTYQKGTIKISSGNGHKSYDLKGVDKSYQINYCGDFQNGQEVDYRVKEDKVYISHEGGKEYKCSIEETMGPNTADPSTYQPATYQKGTILGYEALYRVSKGSASGVRRANVYALRGPDLIYEIDFCGAFQAGQFTAGQVVEFHVSGERLYIVHDNNKEYSCQIEGTQKPESANAAEAAQSASSSTTANGAISTAKLSITSIPDGADIELDGNFSGNTPSDVQIPEGEHSIRVKKSGYKDWERKIKLLAGSSIHLNAEMEKTAP